MLDRNSQHYPKNKSLPNVNYHGVNKTIYSVKPILFTAKSLLSTIFATSNAYNNLENVDRPHELNPR